MDRNDDDIRSVRHSPEFDTESINRAVENASKNDLFVEKAMNLTKDLSFPALKRDIVNHVKGTLPQSIQNSSLSLRASMVIYNIKIHII